MVVDVRKPYTLPYTESSSAAIGLYEAEVLGGFFLLAKEQDRHTNEPGSACQNLLKRAPLVGQKGSVLHSAPTP